MGQLEDISQHPSHHSVDSHTQLVNLPLVVPCLLLSFSTCVRVFQNLMRTNDNEVYRIFTAQCASTESGVWNHQMYLLPPDRITANHPVMANFQFLSTSRVVQINSSRNNIGLYCWHLCFILTNSNNILLSRRTQSVVPVLIRL